MDWSKKLSKTRFDGTRFKGIMTAASHARIDAELFGRCVRKAYQLVSHRGRELLQIVLKEAQLPSISSELKDLVDILLNGGSQNTKDPNTLINRTKKFISTRAAAAASKDQETWHPIPLGCAPHFNPIDSFLEMHEVRDDIKIEWIHSTLKLPTL